MKKILVLLLVLGLCVPVNGLGTRIDDDDVSDDMPSPEVTLGTSGSHRIEGNPFDNPFID